MIDMQCINCTTNVQILQVDLYESFMYMMANKAALCVVLLTFSVRLDGQLIEGN